ncbi:MAG: hypothetical protein ACL7BU_10155 [Candidatus Phlomobacter fragariae]
MWILNLVMYASPYTSSNVVSLHTQEFETFKDINPKAICVKK